MARNGVRAHVAANEPQLSGDADKPADQATTDAGESSPPANRPKPERGRPSWLIRNSRKATIALLLAVIAASPFAYRYLYRNFGPDPLAGIKIDAVKYDPVTEAFKAVKPAAARPPEVDPSGAKPEKAKPAAVAKTAEFAPKPVSPKPSAAPVAPSSGVTHTRSNASTSANSRIAPPVAESPGARDVGVKPQARAQPAVAGACNEAVAALGLCDSSAAGKEK